MAVHPKPGDFPCCINPPCPNGVMMKDVSGMENPLTPTGLSNNMFSTAGGTGDLCRPPSPPAHVRGSPGRLQVRHFSYGKCQHSCSPPATQITTFLIRRQIKFLIWT
ncbi:hypothetical protein Bbelb_440860 [Branchiostoma belcheri]|nr:hypothetical protein Bbelb_440860 [Branchiostoma belcheri]